MWDNFLPEEKNTKLNPANRKTLQELIAMFLECFWANL